MTSFEKTAKKIIAKTNIGKEFMYYLSETYQVSKAKIDMVCAAMNKEHYKLYDNEIWKVYTVSDYTYKQAMYKIIVRNGKAKIYENWSIYNS